MEPYKKHASARPLLIAGALGAALLAGCSETSQQPQGNVITIGAVIDRSGNNAEPSWGDALLLAERQMNEALLAAGHDKVRFHVSLSDSRNDPVTAVARASQLVREQGARALIMDTSQNAVAVNVLHYDADPNNDLRVPIQCSGCTAGSINNPTAMNADPVQQAASRNGQKWMFRTVMSTKLVALLILRDLLKLGTPQADAQANSDPAASTHKGLRGRRPQGTCRGVAEPLIAKNAPSRDVSVSRSAGSIDLQGCKRPAETGALL
jgi:hypothetical protein